MKSPYYRFRLLVSVLMLRYDPQGHEAFGGLRYAAPTLQILMLCCDPQGREG